jgi:hypothetical protein
MTVSFSFLRAGRALAPRKIAGTHFCWRLSELQDHSVARRIRQIENIKQPYLQSNPRPIRKQILHLSVQT